MVFNNSISVIFKRVLETRVMSMFMEIIKTVTICRIPTTNKVNLVQIIKVLFECTVSIDERQPKMCLLFSHSKNRKFAPFLTYLKSWWKVVLNFGKEHANWSNISEVMIGWSWKIKFGKIHFFCQNVNSRCQKCPFYWDWDKNGWSHLVPHEK